MTFSNKPTLRDIIRAEDEQLDDAICSRVGITVDTYKAIRFGFRAFAIGIIAMAWFTPRVQPTPTAYLVLAALVLGPDAVEAYLTRNQ